LNHVGISVSNLDRAIEFYTQMLEMEVAAVFPFGGPLYSQVMGLENARGRLGVVRKGGLQLELFEFAHSGAVPKDANHPVSDRGISHFAVEVSQIEAMYERLLAAGVRFHCPVVTFPGGVKATYGRDQDGNVFELLELPQASASGEAADTVRSF
jgi:catechol 2,3-dioxygenase-like lactoylglutathione lyase family enzyme